METKDIKVDTWALPDLITDVSRGKLRIPQFQRDFVWERSRVIKLLDSMYKDFPIGSFFFWVAPKEYNIFYRRIPELKIKNLDIDGEITFILDGQQRITSLYSTIKGLIIRRSNYYDICFDLDKEIFVARKGDHIRFIPFADFFKDDTSLTIFDKLSDERKKNFLKCKDKFSNYPFSIILVKNKNMEQVCEIFERLNQGGKRLNLFDLVVANTWDKEFKLKDKINNLNKEFVKTFGEIKNEVFVQAICLIQKKQCNRAYQLKLKKEDFKEIWDEFSEALKKSIDFLKNNLGVKTFDIIPYPSLVPMIVYFFYYNKSMDNYQKEKIEEWFWKCSFSERYSSSTLTKMGEDRNIFDKLINNEKVSINYNINIDFDKLKKTNITLSRSAIRNAFLCMLARKMPVNFKDNSPIILDKDFFSTLSSSEKHHIFPKKFLESNKKDHINSILNFCFIPSSLNKEISKKKPSDYFTEYKKTNSKFKDSVSTHLILIENDTKIWEDDYDGFLEQRAELIMKEIKSLVGDITPLEKQMEEKPAEILRVLENKIREVIHVNLYEYYGENYWKLKVPFDVRDSVEKRIQAILKKKPFLKDKFNEPQNKVELCDLMDYPKILLSNWKVFEDIFGSKEQLDKHFKNLKEYRNSIAHSKSMDSITKKEGEVAIEWFFNVINEGEITEDEEENEENELYERLKDKILEINKDIKVEPKKHYIAYKINDRNFLAVKIRKDKIVLSLSGTDFDDPRNMLRDISDMGHVGTGRYQFSLISISDMEYLLNLIKDAFNQIKEKS